MAHEHHGLTLMRRLLKIDSSDVLDELLCDVELEVEGSWYQYAGNGMICKGDVKISFRISAVTGVRIKDKDDLPLY